MKKSTKEGLTIISLVITSVFIFYTFISMIAHPWKFKNNENSSTFTSGILFKNEIIKDKYELIEYGNSIWCFGRYEIYKLRNNDSSNIFDKQIEVCK